MCVKAVSEGWVCECGLARAQQRGAVSEGGRRIYVWMRRHVTMDGVPASDNISMPHMRARARAVLMPRMSASCRASIPSKMITAGLSMIMFSSLGLCECVLKSYTAYSRGLPCLLGTEGGGQGTGQCGNSTIV